MIADKTIRIGIIGAGFARTTQIPGFRNCKEARIVAIASAHRDRAEEVAREFGIDHVEADWRALVARDDVDLVSIVTPVVTHCEMTLAALDAGKAVLCEKPMAMNAGEARRMADRARKAGVLALIDHELRFLTGRVKLHELLRRDNIGKVRHVRLILRADSRADPDWPWNWWSDIKQGGGALGAIGSHTIDGFCWLLGAPVSEVCCNLATHVRQRKDQAGEIREVTTDDETNLLLRFADGELTEGATGNASLSMDEAGKPEGPGIPGKREGEGGNGHQSDPGEHRRLRPPVRGGEAGGEGGDERSRRIGGDEETGLALGQAVPVGVVVEEGGQRREEHRVHGDDRADEPQQAAHESNLPTPGSRESRALHH